MHIIARMVPWVSPLAFFILLSVRMGNGLQLSRVFTRGGQEGLHTVGVLTQSDAGAGRMTAGIGYQVSPGLGLPIITDAGTTMTTMVGCGYLVMTGRLLGSNGDMVVTISVGHRLGRMQSSALALAFTMQPIG
jgi:hypothetical protein